LLKFSSPKQYFYKVVAWTECIAIYPRMSEMACVWLGQVVALLRSPYDSATATRQAAAARVPLKLMKAELWEHVYSLLTF
jgi:hypothetical protein